jgi:hypothetical protein
MRWKLSYSAGFALSERWPQGKSKMYAETVVARMAARTGLPHTGQKSFGGSTRTEPVVERGRIHLNVSQKRKELSLMSDPDPKKFYKWTVELEVNAVWVADGFDLDDERALHILQAHLGYARSHELKARVIQAPDADEVAQEMGYASAEDRNMKEK